LDADVIFSGAASPSEYGVSLVLMKMSELTLIEAMTCRQAVWEVEQNLTDKLPAALNPFRMLVQRCLVVVPDPLPSEIAAQAGKAHPKDLPILVAALKAACPWLITFNTRHFRPGHPNITIERPGAFIRRVRDLLIPLFP
jgi:hypothetical protein